MRESMSILFCCDFRGRQMLILDGTKTVTSPQLFAQVCGLADDAAHSVRLGLALAKGLHHLNVKEAHLMGSDDFKILWRTASGALVSMDSQVLFHRSESAAIALNVRLSTHNVDHRSSMR